MKDTDLLYKTEEGSSMQIYHYDVHTWQYDVKFWLVGNKWCTDLNGNNPVGQLTKEQDEIVQKYVPIIERREKENQNWLAFQKCRKRSCICKSCGKFCECSSCKGKVIDCDKK